MLLKLRYFPPDNIGIKGCNWETQSKRPLDQGRTTFQPLLKLATSITPISLTVQTY